MTSLKRGLTFIDAISIVVGSIIGTGIFLKTSTMSQLLLSSHWVILAWIFAGVLSYAGALTYAELGAIYPNAGGEYVYLREVYGRLPAFLFAWMRLLIATPGSIAAYAVGSATFLSSVFDLTPYGGIKIVAVIFILFFTLLNCLNVSMIGKIQSFLTGLKIFLILFVIYIAFFLANNIPEVSHIESQTVPFNLSNFGLALISALWAFDGWNNLSMVAGEIDNPKKNIPKSFFIGLLIVCILYTLTNISYFAALPFSEIYNSNSTMFKDALPVATKISKNVFGQNGIIILSLGFVISALGAMNGSILTGSRVPFALGEDFSGKFISKLSFLTPKSKVPIISVLFQGVISILLSLSGTFDQLTDYVVFSSWIFYALGAGAVFIIRKKQKLKSDSYQVPFFPILPVLFIIVSLLLLVNSLMNSFSNALIGLTIITLGVPVYYIFFKTKHS